MGISDLEEGRDGIVGAFDGAIREMDPRHPGKSVAGLWGCTLEGRLDNWIEGDTGIPSTTTEDPLTQQSVQNDFQN